MHREGVYCLQSALSALTLLSCCPLLAVAAIVARSTCTHPPYPCPPHPCSADEDIAPDWPGPKAWPATMTLISFFALNVFLQGLRAEL